MTVREHPRTIFDGAGGAGVPRREEGGAVARMGRGLGYGCPQRRAPRSFSERGAARGELAVLALVLLAGTPTTAMNEAGAAWPITTGGPSATPRSVPAFRRPRS
jgi:hypothetical protein